MEKIIDKLGLNKHLIYIIQEYSREKSLNNTELIGKINPVRYFFDTWIYYEHKVIRVDGGIDITDKLWDGKHIIYGNIGLKTKYSISNVYIN
jgi:hypothetical protein